MSYATPYYEDDLITLYNGDCREVVFPDQAIDLIVSDPPYGLEFMGRGWDRGVPGADFWRTFSAYCKPGAPLAAFGGTRTWHRLAVAIEEAGWEIRDTIMWLYGTGFPKSMDVAQAIDKTARGVGPGHADPTSPNHGKYKPGSSGAGPGSFMREAGVKAERELTEAALPFKGYGTALKPAWEPVLLGMNPLAGTFSENAQTFGVAGLNIDAARIPTEPGDYDGQGNTVPSPDSRVYGGFPNKYTRCAPNEIGRFPANVIHDGSAEVLAGFPDTGPSRRGLIKNVARPVQDSKGAEKERATIRGHNDAGGSAARFFYCAKASRAERDLGCEDLPESEGCTCFDPQYHEGGGKIVRAGNTHPTVKPITLMEYLCKLLYPPSPDAVLVDPFAGSGSTLLAALRLGRKAIGIELDPHHCEIAKRRILAARKEAA